MKIAKSAKEKFNVAKKVEMRNNVQIFTFSD